MTQALLTNGNDLRAAHTHRLFMSASLALVTGSLIYLVDRPAGIDLAHASLPSFIHAFAMCLMTAAVYEFNRDNLFSICTAWFLLELLLETAQHPTFSKPLVQGGVFRFGTFDPADIGAALLGCMIAYACMVRCLRKSSNHDQ